MLFRAIGFIKNLFIRKKEPVSTEVLKKKQPSSNVKSKSSKAPIEKKETVKTAKDKTATSKASTSSIKSDNIRLSMIVKEDSWVKVKVDEKTVFQNVLKKGKAETWKANKKIELSLGNAGATELEINGKIITDLGRRGQVIKSIIITKDGMKIGD